MEDIYKRLKDPLFLKYFYKVKSLPIYDKLEIEGGSPTDIFIGRFGYPKVYIGPLIVPNESDVSILNRSDLWKNFSIDDVMNLRYKAVRGVYKTDIKAVEKGKVEEIIRDFALSEKPAYSSVDLTKKIIPKLSFNEIEHVSGPTAEFKGIETGNIHYDIKLEKAYADTDLKATDAVIELYEKGVPITQIQKAFSAGTLGTGKRRRFVPTRWAITAVDDIISKHNIEKIKQYPIIDEPLHFVGEYLGNIWEIDFFPYTWSFKMIEEWLPNQSLGITNKQVGVSEEGLGGRKTYAEIGGSYYACRVSVTEKLVQMRKQASVVVRRIITDKYSLPVGVWQIRTNVKMVLSQ